MLTEILLYRLTEAEVDVNITRTVAVCFALEQMVILVDAEILYAILHAIDYFLPLKRPERTVGAIWKLTLAFSNSIFSSTSSPASISVLSMALASRV